MVRFGEVVVTYFVIGAVMWGAGLVEGGQLGVADIFFDFAQDGAVQPSSEPQGLLDAMGNSILDVASGLVGPVLAVWGVITELIAVLFWPVVTLRSANAPDSVVVLLGGTPTVAFFMGIVRTVRESA
ncbi:MAG: hypothetical protein ACOCSD_07490 [Halolamina sp.]